MKKKLLTAIAALAMTSQLFCAPPPFTKSKEMITVDGLPMFTPPAGWSMADPSALEKFSAIKIMVIGKAPTHQPPSITLAMQPFKGTLKEYLEIIKQSDKNKGDQLKDLGTIKTQAGVANLTQVDSKSQNGEVRRMNAILLKNETIYILCASALKSEFSMFYQDFFKSIKSFRFAKDLYDTISDTKLRLGVQNRVSQLKAEWQKRIMAEKTAHPELSISEVQEEVFNGNEFQNDVWKPFKEMIQSNFGTLGPQWESAVLMQLENELFTTVSNSTMIDSQNPKGK